MHRTTKVVPRAAFALSVAVALAVAARMAVALHAAAVSRGAVTVALATVVSVLFTGALCLGAVFAVADGGWRPRT